MDQPLVAKHGQIQRISAGMAEPIEAAFDQNAPRCAIVCMMIGRDGEDALPFAERKKGR